MSCTHQNLTPHHLPLPTRACQYTLANSFSHSNWQSLHRMATMPCPHTSSNDASSSQTCAEKSKQNQKKMNRKKRNKTIIAHLLPHPPLPIPPPKPLVAIQEVFFLDLKHVFARVFVYNGLAVRDKCVRRCGWEAKYRCHEHFSISVCQGLQKGRKCKNATASYDTIWSKCVQQLQKPFLWSVLKVGKLRDSGRPVLIWNIRASAAMGSVCSHGD